MPYSQERLESDLAIWMPVIWAMAGMWTAFRIRKIITVRLPWKYYSQIYAAFAQAEDSDRCRRLKKRAAEFQREFILWFDWEGAALPYGSH